MYTNSLLSDADRSALELKIRDKFANLSPAELQLRHAALVRVKNRFCGTMRLANWQYANMCVDHCHERIIDLACDGMALTADEVVALEAKGATDLTSEYLVASEVESSQPDADLAKTIAHTYSA